MEYSKWVFKREEKKLNTMKKPNTMKCVALEDKARVRDLWECFLSGKHFVLQEWHVQVSVQNKACLLPAFYTEQHSQFSENKKAKQKATLNSEAVLESERMSFCPWHICSKPQTVRAWFLLLWFSVLGLHVFVSVCILYSTC